MDRPQNPKLARIWEGLKQAQVPLETLQATHRAIARAVNEIQPSTSADVVGAVLLAIQRTAFPTMSLEAVKNMIMGSQAHLVITPTAEPEASRKPMPQTPTALTGTGGDNGNDVPTAPRRKRVSGVW